MPVRQRVGHVVADGELRQEGIEGLVEIDRGGPEIAFAILLVTLIAQARRHIEPVRHPIGGFAEDPEAGLGIFEVSESQAEVAEITGFVRPVVLVVDAGQAAQTMIGHLPVQGRLVGELKPGSVKRSFSVVVIEKRLLISRLSEGA